MSIPFKWQSIPGTNSRRVAVLGGWLVDNEIINDDGKLLDYAMVFVPDQNHEWRVLL